MKLRAPGPKPIILAATRANAGVRAWYQTKLTALIDAMHQDILRTVLPIYRRNPPHALLAKDSSPAVALRTAMRRLGRDWRKNFSQGAQDIARHWHSDVLKHSDLALKTTLRKAGFSVKFQMSRPMNDAYQAVLHDNVRLIKSIPAEHLSDVEGLVNQAVQHGRSMQELTKQLEERYGVTRRRAALIARDQNNKATAVFDKVRKLGLGINHSVWSHTSASKTPRESHEAMNGKTYKTAEGCFDDEYGDFIQPGELINCGCTSQGVIPGLDDDEGSGNEE